MVRPITTYLSLGSLRREGIALVVGVLLSGGLLTPAGADWMEEIGFSQLQSTLHGELPLGADVSISLVEAGGPNTVYFPDTSSPAFDASSDPLGMAVVFTDGSGGQSNGVSGHSQLMSEIFFGNAGLAPGANAVTVYDADNYLNQVLNIFRSSPPDPQNFRVQNFSWVSDDPENPTSALLNQNRKTLRKFDFAIERDNITALVGLNNGTNTLPHLLSHSYNAIAVGRTDGAHSADLTHLTGYGVGRSKPDLVVPRGSTSAATAGASGAAALLHSAVQGTDAALSETMKAILLAGATKDEFPSWSRTTTQPLDTTFGAGELNVFNSYLMTAGGNTAGTTLDPTESVSSSGWDFRPAIQPGADVFYDFEVPAGITAQELSVVLTWNVDVASSFSTQTLADLNLQLLNSQGEIVDASMSSVDNIEHIYLTDLTADTYTLKVSSDTEHDFGLAWRMATLRDTPNADFDGNGDVDGDDFLTWQGGYGTLLDATLGMGDADGDGDVDGDDLAEFISSYGTTSSLPTISLQAIPEPASWLLALAGGLSCYWLCGRRSALARKRKASPARVPHERPGMAEQRVPGLS